MLFQFDYACDKISGASASGAIWPESLRLLEQTDGLSICRQSRTATQFSVAGTAGLACAILGRVCKRDSDSTSNLSAAEFLKVFVAELASGDLLSLKGNFAAVVFDSRAKQLLLITDHLATVPLYYANSPEAATVSTLPQHVAASSHVESGIDEYQVARYCLPCFLPKDKTFFKNVSAVPPASIVKLGTGMTSVSSYWPRDKGLHRLSALSSDEFYSRVRSQVASSVSFAIGGSNRVGLLLSGGIDSSVVAYEACEHFRHSDKRNAVVAACAANRDHDSKSDRYFASLLARELMVRLSLEDGLSFPFEAVDSYFDTTGHPPVDTFYPMQMQLLQGLADQGVTVVLCGEGGESSVSSYGDGWLCQLLSTGKLIALGTEIARSDNLVDAKNLLWETVRPFANRLLAQVLGVTQCFKPFEELARNHCLSSEFVRSVWRDLKGEIECAIDYPNRIFPMSPLSVRQNDVCNLVRINPAYFCGGKAAGVTLACPLLDPDLIDTVMWSKPGFRRAGSRRRLIALSCYQKRLPSEILDRNSKSPFFAAYENWLQRESPKIVGQLLQESPYFTIAEHTDSVRFLRGVQLHHMHRTAVASRFIRWANRKLNVACRP